jgi:uncharacterized protein with von Willebrand factor type A (vWA) domain
VLLLMDAGGSMMPYTQLVERLFSAAHQATHFRDFSTTTSTTASTSSSTPISV